MQCRNCEQPALDNGSGLCDFHFELQREELRQRLRATGEVPVVKLAPKKVVRPQSVAQRRMPLRAWLPVALLVGFLVLVNSYNRESRTESPKQFLNAQPGETWVIQSADVVLMRSPAIPGSASEMASAMVTGVPVGASLRVTGGGASRWKQVALVKGGQVLEGWVLADTVPLASLMN